MQIGKIVNSNSHVDYVGKVFNEGEINESPTPEDYMFAQFVRVRHAEADVIGVIYNSLLINPEYGNYGPRLSTPPETNAVFSPDYINELGVLIGILLIGWRAGEQNFQRIPRAVLPVGSIIERLNNDEMLAFHLDQTASLQMHYLPHVITHGGQLARQLLITIIEQLSDLTTEENRAKLRVLERTLVWQHAMAQMN